MYIKGKYYPHLRKKPQEHSCNCLLLFLGFPFCSGYSRQNSNGLVTSCQFSKPLVLLANVLGYTKGYENTFYCEGYGI